MTTSSARTCSQQPPTGGGDSRPAEADDRRLLSGKPDNRDLPAGADGNSLRQAAEVRDGERSLRARRFDAELLFRLRNRRDQQDEPAVAAGSGGPLAHQRSDLGATSGATMSVRGDAPVDAVANRILSGIDGSGRPAARVDLGGLASGTWAGSTVELVAGVNGVEVSVFAATAAARRVIETQLAELTRALHARGVKVGKLRVKSQPSRGRDSRHWRTDDD